MRAILILLTASTAPLSLIAATPALAQEQGTEGVTRYPPDFFARAQPVNANDMGVLVPGFRIIEGDAEVRGYSGAAGNVLIDGQRPAGKAETIETLLKRIPASRVREIQLIRAGAAGFDMQGYAVIVNIVLESNSKLSGRAEGEYAIYRHGYRAPRVAGQLAYGSGSRRIDLSGAVYREIDDEHGYGSRNRYALNGSPVRLASYFQPEGTDVIEGTIGYRQPLTGGDLRLSGLIRDARMFANIGYDVRVPAIETIRGSERKHTRTYEAGLRYERPLGDASSVELIASHRAVSKTALESETSASGSDRSNEHADSSESILRVAFRHRTGPLALEMGGEGAINILDSANLFFEDNLPVAIPNAHVRVEEQRAEIFATATWTLSPGLSLETGARYEFSRLEQSGDTELGKSLAFLKPRVRLSWMPGKRDQLRFLFEREVGQLDFGDFVGAASINSGTISAGNRDLEPDSLWRAELSYEHGIGAGSLVLAARREWISDLIDQLPIHDGGTVYDAVGNIGSATRTAFEANLNLPLDSYGLKGVTVKADGLFQRSEATDPTTGETRRISGDTPVEAGVTLTHDIPAWQLRWGSTWVFAAEDSDFKVSEVQTDRIEGRLDLFVEYKPRGGWSLRLFAKNLTDSPVTRTRDVFTGPRGVSALRYRDVRTLRSGPYFGLTIQRSFGE
ncbi:TonB-dependent receptor [Sphingomonas sp. G-3-2-10]|uniref:TonB-dependent receptor plug domain-containing protein n=1 Tax=Sphingomonas sp. G-3-2-10 TaxID=2728838 RepID=UPI00146BB04A|nr:TonB-dependent receptor [Sphingomonas sp. G-3-2-10]NML07408.1 TonB-dependent receptor [Sphingomonas sp. G-3-2-10]